MRKYISLTILITIMVMMPMVAQADVFDALAEKAGDIGKGLRDSGYLITGLGLIGFAVFAIFGKVNWKTFFYIIASAFILSSMVGLIKFINPKAKINFADPAHDTTNRSAGTDTSVSSTGGPDQSGNNVNRDTQHQ